MELLEALAASLRRQRGKLAKCVRLGGGYLMHYDGGGPAEPQLLVEIVYGPEMSFIFSRFRAIARTIAYVEPGEGSLVVSHALLAGRQDYHLARKPLVRVSLADPKALAIVAERLSRLVGVDLIED